MVLMIALVISVFGGILAETAIQHDPIVQTDEIDHFAYRALEAGINTFMSKANDDPNEMACNASSLAGGQCQAGLYGKWKQVVGTTGTPAVPEYFAWGTPRFCYTESCPPSTPTAAATPPKPVIYVKETIYGAAGFGTRMSYQHSTLNLKPVNGFLTRIWWSTYEASDPHLQTRPTSTCTYNYDTGYKGPNTSGTNICSPVVFATGTQVYGPIYTNDSIYITGHPTLGPVGTADPNCLFVSASGSTCYSQASQAAALPATRVVQQGTVTFQADVQGAKRETLPKTDNTLEAYAALDGCVYNGPTTIEFDGTDTMTVWSKDTPERPAGGTKPECPSTHTATGPATTTQHTAPVPNSSTGDGVIYVNTAPSATCVAGANPFDDFTTSAKTNGSHAQYASTGALLKYDYFGPQPGTTPNCEGDAFVSDAPTTGGVQGQLTIGAHNDVVITGTIKYEDCGTGFNSTKTFPCRINTTGSKNNDSLGLIAQNYVLVNHPVTSVCTTKIVYKRGIGTVNTRTCKVTRSTIALAPTCKATQLGTPAAAICNPVADGSGSVLTIDAAVLALNHSFGVDLEGLPSGRGCYGIGSLDGTLKVYGSIDQKWRGAVGCVGASGYTKEYDWNSEGAVITPPHYLAPATPSWAVGSSAITVDQGPPKWCFTSTTPSKGVKSPYATTPACNPTG